MIIMIWMVSIVMNGHPTMDGLQGKIPSINGESLQMDFFWIVEFTSEWLVYFMENSHENSGTFFDSLDGKSWTFSLDMGKQWGITKDTWGINN